MHPTSEPSLFNFRYKINRKLGEGAQGTVHLATDTLTDQQVAIKVLHVGQSDRWLALFRHEFEILADLSHPYLAQVYDFGVTPDGQVFFTRDYIHGQDLIDATRNIVATRFVAICVQMCRALRPLHRSGLLHGDIKPGNLVFGPASRNADGTWRCTAYPIDFSFVRPASGQAPPRGTLQYIAPEILEQQPVDVRADLYALGVSIYQAAEGKAPFEAEIRRIQDAHRRGYVPPWTAAGIGTESEQDKDMLIRLGAIVQRLLATHPDDRFVDLEELEAALTGLCPGAVIRDTASYIPSRNVLTSESGLSRDGVSRQIFETLQQHFAQRGSHALFVVEGEVGAGRSAIRKAVKWQAQLQGIHVLEMSLYGETDWLWPVKELLLQTATVLGGTPDAQKCLDTASQLSDFERSQTGLHPLMSTVVTIIKSAASVCPILLTVENINRACGEMLTLLRAVLALSQKDVSIALLATTVAEFHWRDALGPGVSHFIPPLNEAEIARLVKCYLSVEGAHLAGKILEHTGGNPLFVTQLLHNCIVTEQNAETVINETVVKDVQSYWQIKLGELSAKERLLLKAIGVIGVSSDVSLILEVADLDDGAAALLAGLEQQRWLKRSQNVYSIRSNSLARQILNTIDDGEWQLLSRRAFLAETRMEQRILHAANIGENDFLTAQALPVVSALEQQGALSAARRLLDAIVNSPHAYAIRDEAALSLGRILIALGELARAQKILLNQRHSPDALVRQSALRYLGKIAVQQSALDEAASLLTEALTIDGDATTAATVYYELCEIEFRRGRYGEAIETANRGLDLLKSDDHHRCNLLCSKAKINAARGKHDVAMLLADEAVALATKHQQKQLLAFATDIRAWVLGLKGNLEKATAELEKCALLYREMGDTARLARSLQIIGNNYWWLEKWALMIKNHEEALHVVASLDNPAGRNEQLIAYGYALICVGRFEKSALIFKRARAEATRIDDHFQLAKIAVYEGNWNAWQGNLDDALTCWKEGYQGFEALSTFALLSEIALNMAGALISRNRSADLLAAEKWIEKADSFPREDQGRHIEYMLQLTKGRFLIANGRIEDGSLELNDLIRRLNAQPVHEILWQAYYYMALALLGKGMKVLARKQLRLCETSLNTLSDGLPPEHQISFWQDARRADIKRLLEQFSSEQLCDSGQFEIPPNNTDETVKLYKVLDFNKRISRETNVEVLTEEILDSAIELTGAERGFFLAKGLEGLYIRAARQLSKENADSPHYQFSSSIAESVYLDNEPVLTTDAAKDPRFNEFLSIHHLQIKSVACLPIAFRAEVLGVLYLENRLTHGRFDHRDMRVLSAFADQMAIALAHASVLAEKNRIHQDLAETARQLNELVVQQSEDIKSKEAVLELANEQLSRIREKIASTGNYNGMVGTGRAMQKVFNLIERVRDNDIPVVITGPSGTGKDMVAKVIHETGRRSTGPFVTLSCGSIPENLVESTLFGYRKGAFSGAQIDSAGIFASASGGTLYLDDIAEMPQRMQVDLLRVLQEGAYTPLGDNRKFTIDFRILCSSKMPLKQLVELGRLREDLFYRLQVISIELPALNAREEDIPVLAVHIARAESARLQVPWSGFSASVVRQLTQKDWHGNIREMEQHIRRLLIIGDGEETSENLSAMGFPLQTAAPAWLPRQLGFGKKPALEDEREQVIAALDAAQWNKTKAAELLGMPRRTFYRRLKHFGIV
ncbi:MAG: sigma 54-interacting transcriptional regulator [Deltaproteobacteria bacterium]|nr:sigma 54-interacting transcriptional regulator [Deltaproteobacteria bacterium]